MPAAVSFIVHPTVPAMPTSYKSFATCSSKMSIPTAMANPKRCASCMALPAAGSPMVKS
jgi:hypothetical protein